MLDLGFVVLFCSSSVGACDVDGDGLREMVFFFFFLMGIGRIYPWRVGIIEALLRMKTPKIQRIRHIAGFYLWLRMVLGISGSNRCCLPRMVFGFAAISSVQAMSYASHPRIEAVWSKCFHSWTIWILQYPDYPSHSLDGLWLTHVSHVLKDVSLTS